jgi:hypothetical protein
MKRPFEGPSRGAEMGRLPERRGAPLLEIDCEAR